MKLTVCNTAKGPLLVAPHAGAWIETGCPLMRHGQLSVAPHAGAWIETPALQLLSCPVWSPPTRGRGLKPPYPPSGGTGEEGRPPRGGVD